MLTLSQQIVIEQFAKELIVKIGEVFKHKNIMRKSVRYEGGKRIERTYSSPISASGNLVKSLRFNLTETHLEIWSEDYVYFLIHGRKPTKGGGSGAVKDKIRDWIDHKGIKADIDKDTLAYLIARKIHREGNSIYLYYQGKNSGLLNNILTEEMKQEFNDKFTRQLGEDLANEFNGN